MKHWKNRRRNRDGTFARETRPVEEKFWANVRVTEDHWYWTGNTVMGGYGVLSVGAGKTQLAHRISYELLVGPIPEGLTIDHLCRVTSCVRPDHLEPVRQRENNRRGGPLHPAAVNARKTHCKHGHPFDEQNTIIRPNGMRDCRKCMTRRCREYYLRRRCQ